MNANRSCDDLDAYLNSDLSTDESKRFTAHLESCGECRDAVDQQHWVNGLLRSPEFGQRELPPRGLVAAIHSKLSQTRQRAGLVACGLAAAAVLLLALGWIAMNRSPAPTPGDLPGVLVAENHEERVEQEVVVTRPRAVVITGPDSMAVPVESPYPDVTIVRILPTYQPDFATHASAAPSSANGEFVWPNEDSNGGTL